MFHADSSHEHSLGTGSCVSTKKKKNIYIFFCIEWTKQRMRRQRGSLEEEGAKEGQQETVGDIPALAEASQPPFPLSPSFRPRYFPALFLIYEPSGDSSFRSLINEGPDWIRDCNSGKFSGREITPHPRPVCTNKGTQGSVVPLSHSNAMIKKS